MTFSCANCRRTCSRFREATEWRFFCIGLGSQHGQRGLERAGRLAQVGQIAVDGVKQSKGVAEADLRFGPVGAVVVGREHFERVAIRLGRFPDGLWVFFE